MLSLHWVQAKGVIVSSAFPFSPPSTQAIVGAEIKVASNGTRDLSLSRQASCVALISDRAGMTTSFVCWAG